MNKSFFSVSNLCKILIVTLIAALFSKLNFPVPWIMGSLMGAFFLAIIGYKIEVPPFVRGYILSIVGLQMGSLVTYDMLVELRGGIGLLVGLFILVPLYMVITQALYQKIMGFSAQDGFLCSAPGLLSYVLIVAQEKKSDLSLIVFTHTLRLIFLVVILPLIIVGSIVHNPPVIESFKINNFENIIQTLLIVFLIIIFSKYLVRLKLIAPWLLVAIFVSTISILGFHYSLKPSPIFLTMSQIALGCMLASNINRNDFRRPLSFYLKMLLVFALSLTFIILGTFIVITLTDIDVKTALLAYSPGGLEAMIMISVTLASHPLLVSAAHVIRSLYLSLIIPIMFARIEKNTNK
ncbi:MAG: AbrB family transcriptional regulator [Alphaproteobacteria bacterium]